MFNRLTPFGVMALTPLPPPENRRCRTVVCRMAIARPFLARPTTYRRILA